MADDVAATVPDISIVVPVLNEAESLQELYRALQAALDGLPHTAEIIFVDDGSDDGSFGIMQQLHSADARVRVLKLRRNFGKSTALRAGFRASQGDVILTIDGDLQDVPGEIPKLLSKLGEGFDLVSGWRTDRKDRFLKLVICKCFNALTSFLTGVKLHDLNAGLKAYRAEVTRAIHLYGEMHRFIPVFASYKGFRVAEIPTLNRPRRSGKSKYGPGRVLAGFFDLLTILLLTRYGGKPLHLFGMTGLLFVLIGLAINLFLTVKWFLGVWIGNRPLLILGVLLIVVGIQFVFFGLLAEIIIYLSGRETKGVVEEELG